MSPLECEPHRGKATLSLHPQITFMLLQAETMPLKLPRVSLICVFISLAGQRFSFNVARPSSLSHSLSSSPPRTLSSARPPLHYSLHLFSSVSPPPLLLFRCLLWLKKKMLIFTGFASLSLRFRDPVSVIFQTLANTPFKISFLLRLQKTEVIRRLFFPVASSLVIT